MVLPNASTTALMDKPTYLYPVYDTKSKKGRDTLMTLSPNLIRKHSHICNARHRHKACVKNSGVNESVAPRATPTKSKYVRKAINGMYKSGALWSYFGAAHLWSFATPYTEQITRSVEHSWCTGTGAVGYLIVAGAVGLVGLQAVPLLVAERSGDHAQLLHDIRAAHLQKTIPISVSTTENDYPNSNTAKYILSAVKKVLSPGSHWSRCADNMFFPALRPMFSISGLIPPKKFGCPGPPPYPLFLPSAGGRA